MNYRGLSVPESPAAAGLPVNAAVTVTNTGKMAVDEVVQLYLRFPPIDGAPRMALRAFHLNPGKVDTSI